MIAKEQTFKQNIVLQRVYFEFQNKRNVAKLMTQPNISSETTK